MYSVSGTTCVLCSDERYFRTTFGGASAVLAIEINNT